MKKFGCTLILALKFHLGVDIILLNIRRFGTESTLQYDYFVAQECL